ncbi:scopoletin glucosyltransferase-like [Ananas comosus]|uniref:Glycosyltransferase n=1 Tax=Ananas comosus TaxID=4615 RepID=A0A6P5G518_ANACO|nr:scopoletin glucosyltransferase-like [Ananas comosus]
MRKKWRTRKNVRSGKNEREAARDGSARCLAAGHMLPMLDMARLFAERGVRVSVAVTPSTAAGLLASSYPSLRPVLLPPFSSATAGLPDGAESTSALPSALISPAFIAACDEFSSPFLSLLRLHRPHALVADFHFPWAAHHAASLSLPIPLLSFHGTSHFSTAVAAVLSHAKPHLDPALVDDEDASFLLPWLPDPPIRLTRAEIPGHVANPTDLVRRMSEAHALAHGMLMNSFRAFEAPYLDLMSRFVRSWTLGPVHLPLQPQPQPHSDVVSWLYVCFGSLGRFTPAQLRAIALGLEAAGRPFVWVVKKELDVASPECLPAGFEGRVGERGRIVNGWAPQRAILRHAAVGGFVTHCGWNSLMEAVAAGKPLATWPLHAEQFFNERFVVDVAGVGVRVGGGAKKRAWSDDEAARPDVPAEEVAAAVIIRRCCNGGRSTPTPIPIILGKTREN